MVKYQFTDLSMFSIALDKNCSYEFLTHEDNMIYSQSNDQRFIEKCSF